MAHRIMAADTRFITRRILRDTMGATGRGIILAITMGRGITGVTTDAGTMGVVTTGMVGIGGS